MKGKKNPYVQRLKQPVTIRLDGDTVAYFKALASKTGLPYQNLINLYLRDCASHRRELSLSWVEVRTGNPGARQALGRRG